MSTLESLFDRLVTDQPSRPFVTYYDHASGERSELSVKSLANWVAKTHFLLTDELGLGVTCSARVALPAHWISIPVLLGCLTAGLALQTDGSADVAFVTADVADVEAADVFAINPASVAVGFQGEEPSGVSDYVAAVRPQADAWASVQMPATESDPCLLGLTRAAVVERARATGLADGARILTTREWSTPQDWIDTVFAPLAVGGSVVIVANCTDESVVERRVTQERATVRV